MLCENILSEEDNDPLTKDIEDEEIWDAIKRMNCGKSPGSDGLPVEFYKKIWKFIKPHFLEVIKCMLERELSTSQYEGIIKLISKKEDLELLENWRPISLLNVDYKICAKMLANRLKYVMEKIISKEQFCGVPGRSIVECNNFMRDIIQYSNDENVNVGLLNLDWAKAFDRVSIDFLFKIMGRLGFSNIFLKWLKIMYKTCNSSLCINGIISSPFRIKRSVRQGCPLSMMLYVIFQEPLYLAIKANALVVPPSFPNMMTIKIQGYADDSTVIVTSDLALQEVCKVIEKFEEATGALLNKEKTSIMGIGSWSKRATWPVNWLKRVENTKILGIEFFCNYEETVENNWNTVIEKIRNHATCYHRGI